MDNMVHIVQCPDYDQAGEKIAALLDRMGGMGRFVGRGEQIVLKANLLRESRPEEAVCTHPAVVGAVGREVRQAGAEPLIVDSPGGGYRYSKRILERIYRTTGMLAIGGQAGIGLNRDTTFRAVPYPEGVLIKHFDIITPVLEADAVINLPKMKTHLFTGMTGAVKNIFGVIPGRAKPGYHAKLHDVQRFAGMLLDLHSLISPRLSIMDAIVAMQGDGPGTGDPRPVGLLLGSRNSLALDVAAAEIMGLPRELNPVLLEAERRGLRPHRIEQVEIVGADLAHVKVADFKAPRAAAGRIGLGPMPWYQQILEPLFKDAFTVRPRVIQERCIACGTCIKGCPMDAIHLVKERAFIDDDKCIRCYCCHEMCPEEAIGLYSSWLYQLIKLV